MKYPTKTAIEIMTEEDRLEVIPFFEHHFPNCNNGFWREDEIHIGQIWIVNEHLLLNWRERKLLSDYTILKGVPKDWREENVGLTETFIENCGVKIMPSRLDQLESENKELRECLYGMILYGQVYEVTSVIYSEGEHRQLIERSKKLFTNNF